MSPSKFRMPCLPAILGWLILGCGSAPYEGHTIEELRTMLASEDPAIRAQAAIGLSLAGDDAAVAVAELAHALSDPKPQVRAQAAVALGAIGPLAAEAVPALIQRLDDPDILVRRQAIVALGRIGKPAEGALARLSLFRKDESPILKSAAKESIVQIRGDSIPRKPAE